MYRLIEEFCRHDCFFVSLAFSSTLPSFRSACVCASHPNLLCNYTSATAVNYDGSMLDNCVTRVIEGVRGLTMATVTKIITGTFQFFLDCAQHSSPPTDILHFCRALWRSLLTAMLATAFVSFLGWSLSARGLQHLFNALSSFCFRHAMEAIFFFIFCSLTACECFLKLGLTLLLFFTLLC